MRRHSDSGVLPSSCARLTSCSSVAGFMPLGLLMYKSKTKMASSVVHCSAFISILLLNDGQIYFFSSESVALLFAILETPYLCTYIHVRRIDIYMKRKTKKGKGMMKTWLAVLVALGVCYVFGVYKQTGKVDVPAIAFAVASRGERWRTAVTAFFGCGGRTDICFACTVGRS